MLNKRLVGLKAAVFLLFFLPPSPPPVGYQGIIGGGGFALLAHKDQLSHQEGETVIRHVMEGPCSSGNSVKFITASCSHIYHWHITTCNQSQMSGVVLTLRHSSCLDTGISYCIMHLMYVPGERRRCARISRGVD